MLGTNVMSLDTNLATDGDSFEVIADCIDGLMQMDADGAAQYALAESYDLSEDGLTYTFHLRDASWTNGTPVTAEDFVFAWCRICELAGEYAYMMDEIGNIKGAAAIIAGEESDTSALAVTAEDDKTLKVELEVPVSFFPSLMYFPTFYPINKEFYASLEDGTYGTSPETFLSCGAFTLTDYLPGTANLTVTKNEGYWDAARVHLPGITYQVVGSSDNAIDREALVDNYVMDGSLATYTAVPPQFAASAHRRGLLSPERLDRSIVQF